MPLGHPGDSLGATDSGFPLTPPEHWQTGQRPDGTVFAADVSRRSDQLREVPYVAEDEPGVCAWYPSARKVVVWNLVEETRSLTLVQGTRRSTARVGPLEVWVTEIT